mgnify:CR=1 FL=1
MVYVFTQAPVRALDLLPFSLVTHIGTLPCTGASLVLMVITARLKQVLHCSCPHYKWPALSIKSYMFVLTSMTIHEEMALTAGDNERACE